MLQPCPGPEPRQGLYNFVSLHGGLANRHINRSQRAMDGAAPGHRQRSRRLTGTTQDVEYIVVAGDVCQHCRFHRVQSIVEQRRGAAPSASGLRSGASHYMSRQTPLLAEGDDYV